MAVGGLPSPSISGSLFLRDAQSPQSRQWGDQDSVSTRASSILQMWWDLEGERVTNHSNVVRFGERPQLLTNESLHSYNLNGPVPNGPQRVNSSESLELIDIQNESHSPLDSENEHEDCNSIGSQHFVDLREVERERVRQIFREWKSSGSKYRSSNASCSNNFSRAQWLGENERERVRLIREWVQVSYKQNGSCVSSAEESPAGVGSQIELIRDGFMVNQCNTVEKRPIRKLCGRQTLLDLLEIFQRERKSELQQLSEHKPVSNFSHRSRIQFLLRGRFLRNESVRNERPISRAIDDFLLPPFESSEILDGKDIIRKRRKHSAADGSVASTSQLKNHAEKNKFQKLDKKPGRLKKTHKRDDKEKTELGIDNVDVSLTTKSGDNDQCQENGNEGQHGSAGTK